MDFNIEVQFIVKVLDIYSTKAYVCRERWNITVMTVGVGYVDCQDCDV